MRSGKASPTDDEFEQTWKKIDKDGDGTLSCEELASHFGFDLNKSGSMPSSRSAEPPALRGATPSAAARRRYRHRLGHTRALAGDEMSEEQILAALSMQAFLFDDVFKKLSKESSGRRKSVRRALAFSRARARRLTRALPSLLLSFPPGSAAR